MGSYNWENWGWQCQAWLDPGTLAVFSIPLALVFSSASFCVGLNLRDAFLHRVRKTALPSLPMSTMLIISQVLSSQSPSIWLFGMNLIDWLSLGQLPTLGPIAMSRGIDSKVAKAVGTVGALVSTGTTWVGHLGRYRKQCPFHLSP